MRKLIPILLILSVLGACSTTKPKNVKPAPVIVKHLEYKKYITYKFDVLLDNPISINDPRIKSIIYSINQSPNNFVSVAYYNKHAKKIVKNYVQLFEHAHIRVVTTKLDLDKSDKDNIKYIFVTGYYGIYK